MFSAFRAISTQPILFEPNTDTAAYSIAVLEYCYKYNSNNTLLYK